MSYAAQNQDWGQQRGYGPAWCGPPFFWNPMWVVLMILGFVFWWPLGLIILGIAIGSRKMGCWSGRGYANWQDRMQDKMDRMRAKMDSFGSGPWGANGSSGNRAFDEYRTETLRRLEEEQREFRDFLARLRMAKDKSEFDQFMAERRNRPEPPPQPPQS
jgi:hypothetical protein